VIERERNAIEALIEWAVAPAPPLPPVAATGAVAAFLNSLDSGPRSQRLAVHALVFGFRRNRDRLLRGPLAPIGEALAGLAQLAYYGEPAVLRVLGCPA
jgi:hypothetical protein